jgi:hypothetical protein
MGGVFTLLSPSIIGEHSCPPGKKESVSKLDMSLTNKSCIPLQNIDVSMYMLCDHDIYSLIVRCIIKSGFARYSFLGTAPTLEHTHSI